MKKKNPEKRCCVCGSLDVMYPGGEICYVCHEKEWGRQETFFHKQKMEVLQAGGIFYQNAE